MYKRLRSYGFVILLRCGLVMLMMTACNEPEPETQVLVSLDAEPALRKRLLQVRVSLYADGEATDAPARREQLFLLTASDPKAEEHQLPFSFSIVPRERRAMSLVVHGYAARGPGAVPIVEQLVKVTFLQQRALDLTVLLKKVVPICGEEAADATRGFCSASVSGSGSRKARQDDITACEDLPDGVCDPVAQCNCDAPEQCQVADGEGLCGVGGLREQNELCEYNDECVGNLSCAWGVCRHACRSQDDCRQHASPTAECVRREAKDRFGFCAEPCAKPGAARCADGLLCSPIRTDEVQGNFCLQVEARCSSTDDDICDEPGRGTGFCETDTDANDCCEQPRPGDSCDLISQCGCIELGACRADSVSLNWVNSTCDVDGNKPIGSVCGQHSDCVRGAGCYQSICKRFCNDTGRGRCPAGECVPLEIDGNVARDAGSCWQSCDWKTHEPCMPDTVCARFDNGDFCHAQPSACPEELLDNGKCDEDTRVCAPGTDTDCAR